MQNLFGSNIQNSVDGNKSSTKQKVFFHNQPVVTLYNKPYIKSSTLQKLTLFRKLKRGPLIVFSNVTKLLFLVMVYKTRYKMAN